MIAVPLEDWVRDSGMVAVGESMFPAKITLEDGTVHDRVKVWLVQSPDGEGWGLVALGLDLEPIVSVRVTFVDLGKTERVLATVNGEIRYSKGGGCSCGTRLRSYKPWRRVIAVTNPRHSG